jgi:hypothetical protein
VNGQDRMIPASDQTAVDQCFNARPADVECGYFVAPKVTTIKAAPSLHGCRRGFDMEHRNTG